MANEKPPDLGFRPRGGSPHTAGVQVIRLGHLVASELGVSHPLVCDYATSGRRSELLDVFIPPTATAAISTLTGSDPVANVGRRPVLYVDIALYAQVFQATTCNTWIPAHLRGKRDNRVLSLAEVFSRGIGWFVERSQFANENIEAERTSPEEIEGCAREFISSVLQHGCHVGDDSL